MRGAPDPTDDPNDALERLAPFAALGLVFVGFVLRLRGLSEYWLNPDEGIYYSTLTRAAFVDFWAEVAANAHPPAYYLLLRAAGFLTWDFVWLRALSVICGAAAVWVFWLVGRELGGRGRAGVVAGLVAAGLLAVSREAIVLSQVLRPYMLLLALLAFALLHLLRYRSQPTDRNLAAYVTLASLAALVHYSAALALGAFVALVAYFRLAARVSPERWRRLALAQAIPLAVVAALYVQHLGAALESDLVGDALQPGGWLSDWLVASPADAWDSLVAFQIFHLPLGFQGRTALLLLAAIAVSAVTTDRIVAVLTAAALLVALLASVLDLYPFGPSRHNTWLVAFTLPSLAWLAGRLAAAGWRAGLAGSAAVIVLLAFGAPLERALGTPLLRTNETEEMLILRGDLAPLVVDQLNPDGGPRLILMSEQTYNLLMPLYAREREDVVVATDSTLYSFPYGARRVIVARRWDWSGLEDVRDVVRGLTATLPAIVPSSDPSLLLLAGGWDSSVFAGASELRERGAILGGTLVFGPAPSGGRTLRLASMVLDWRLLTEAP